MACIDQPIRRPIRPVRRRTRRGRERGAAMVEAAFMLPMFVILWYSSLYAHNLGSGYIGVNTKARQDSWSTAMANCGSSGQLDSEVLPPTDGSGTPMKGSGTNEAHAVSTAFKNGNIPGAIAAFVNTFTQIISNIFPNPDGATSIATQNVNFRVPDIYNKTYGQHGTDIEGKITIVCNEAPQNGSITNVASGIVSLITGIVKSIF